MAVDAGGSRLPAPAAGDPGPAVPTHAIPGAGVGVVWLDRAGTPHANDAMVLERLAIGLAISIDRRADRTRDSHAHERRPRPARRPARTVSVRAAATLAGVHHSAMQARVAGFCGALGFDARTPAGRVRLSDALRLHRLTTAHFD